MCSTANGSSNTTPETFPCRNSSEAPLRDLPLHVLVPWAVAYASVAVVVLVGNSLVILSFVKTKRLRTRTNYFIVSLSATDWLVGAISLPWWILLTFVNHQGQTWFDMMHEIWVVFDILGGVGSIMHLVALSWDRLCAIVWPLRHRMYSKQKYIYILCFVWMCALAVAGSSPYGRERSKTAYNVSVIILFFFVPLLIICLAQGVILLKIRRQSALNTLRRNFRQESRVTKTISLMVGLFVIGWLPFFSLSLLVYTSPKAPVLPWQAVCIVKFLQYSNSAINPVLYAHNFPHFRKAYTAVLCPCREISKTARYLADSFRGTLLSRSTSRAAKGRKNYLFSRRKPATGESSCLQSTLSADVIDRSASAGRVVQVHIELQHTSCKCVKWNENDPNTDSTSSNGCMVTEHLT